MTNTQKKIRIWDIILVGVVAQLALIYLVLKCIGITIQIV